jgi:hypothetical protein
MREILFRGKRKDNGAWETGGILVPEPPYVYGKEGTAIIYNPPSGLTSVVLLETIGQFTGILDKNGVKIFEGDIVDIVYRRGRIDKAEWGRHVIEYLDYGFMQRELNNPDAIDEDMSLPVEYYEVVGNIHDNPEMLEGLQYDTN